MAEVKISENRYTVDSLFQWDKNQMLYIYGVTGVKSPEIHFANDEMGRTIVRTPSVDSKGVISVEVPNSLLQKSFDIKVYICGYEGETFKTYYKIIVPVKARTKPSDYTLDPNDGEVYSFNKVEKELAEVKTLVTNNEEVCEQNSKAVNEAVKTVKQYESRVENLETNTKNLGNEKLNVAQGTDNANKVMTTDEEGNIIPSEKDYYTSTQVDESLEGKVDLDGSNLTDEHIASWKTKLELTSLADYDESKGTIEERLTSLGFSEGSAYLGDGISATQNKLRRQGNYAIFTFEGMFEANTDGIYYFNLPSKYVPNESFSMRAMTLTSGLSATNSTTVMLIFEAGSPTVEVQMIIAGGTRYPIFFQVGYEVYIDDDVAIDRT